MPCATRRCGSSFNRSTSPSLAMPLAGMAPMMERKSVVFPEPLRPIMPQKSPSSSANEALRMIGTGPIDTLRSVTLNIGEATPGIRPGTADQRLNALVGQRGGRRAVGDHGAVIKRQHALGEALDDLHVVLDEKHGDLAVAQCGHDDLHQVE